MKAIYARKPSEEEYEKLKAGLKSASGVTVRRSQIIMMSAEEQKTAQEIGERVGQSDQQVRKVLHAFNEKGISCVNAQSRARHDDQRAYKDDARERLREIIRQSPRENGYESSLWTLGMLAEVSHQQGLIDHQVHPDTVSQTLLEMGVNWRRAKHWINSPDENYKGKKSAETG
jgi:transposase